jgi:hypothetical protein
MIDKFQFEWTFIHITHENDLEFESEHREESRGELRTAVTGIVISVDAMWCFPLANVSNLTDCLRLDDRGFFLLQARVMQHMLNAYLIYYLCSRYLMDTLWVGSCQLILAAFDQVLHPF